jgi:hypothetical protein
MNAHLADAFVVELGWRALQVLLDADEVDPEALAAFGVQQLAAATLQAHPRVNATIIACCSVLCLLLDWADGHETLDFGVDGVTEAIASRMLAAGGCSEDVEPLLFSAAAYLLSTRPDTNARVFAGAGGMDAVVAAVMRLPRCSFQLNASKQGRWPADSCRHTCPMVSGLTSG